MLQKGMYNYRAKLTNLVVSMHNISDFFFYRQQCPYCNASRDSKIHATKPLKLMPVIYSSYLHSKASASRTQ